MEDPSNVDLGIGKVWNLLHFLLTEGRPEDDLIHCRSKTTVPKTMIR
jgi:hypothetical protein